MNLCTISLDFFLIEPILVLYLLRLFFKHLSNKICTIMSKCAKWSMLHRLSLCQDLEAN